jgi:hypothetical protein
MWGGGGVHGGPLLVSTSAIKGCVHPADRPVYHVSHITGGLHRSRAGCAAVSLSLSPTPCEI